MSRVLKKASEIMCFAAFLCSSAVSSAAQDNPGDIFDSGYMFQVFGALLLVFGCLFGLMFVLKKLNGLPSHNKGIIQVLGSAKVGTREKIVLLRAGEQHLLIGVASGSIRTLHRFENDAPGLGGDNIASGNSFASLLQTTTSGGETR